MSTQYLKERRGPVAAVAFVIAVACASIAPSFAGAATVASGEYELTVQASPGELNTLSASSESLGGGQQRTTFHDETVPLVAGAGCAQAAPNTVTCQTNGPAYVDFLLDDLNDRLTFDSGSFGRITAHGGEGDDVITNITVGNGIDYGGQVFGDAGNDQLTSRGLIHGGEGNDRIEGGPTGDTLIGGAGNDAVFGWEGNDELFGGNGRYSDPVQPGVDSLDGGVGDDAFDDQDRGSRTVQQIDSDSIVGGTGDDTVNSYQNRVADVYVDLTDRAGTASAVRATTSPESRGSRRSGDDRLYGDGDANVIFGNAGDDDVAGRGGDDQLIATQGDTASGDLGRDRIVIYRDSTGYIRCAEGRDRVARVGDRRRRRAGHPHGRAYQQDVRAHDMAWRHVQAHAGRHPPVRPDHVRTASVPRCAFPANPRDAAVREPRAAQDPGARLQHPAPARSRA